jgi:AhpC/TSA family
LRRPSANRAASFRSMEANGEQPRAQRPRPPAAYTALVGVVFVAVIAVAGINLLSNEDAGVLDPADAGWPLPQFAVPDVRSELSGDANIAQDDCAVSQIPCPRSERRLPACEVDLEGAIRVCDLFDRPLVLSFWFTRGGDCESQQDVFEQAYRRFSARVNFLGIVVRDSREDVRELISERGWSHPIGLDSDGALGSLYRIGGCPTFLYAYPGGILQTVSIGELEQAAFDRKVRELLAASSGRRRAEG